MDKEIQYTVNDLTCRKCNNKVNALWSRDNEFYDYCDMCTVEKYNEIVKRMQQEMKDMIKIMAKLL